MFEIFKNRYFFRNELARYLLLLIWAIINIIAFVVTFVYYHNALEFFYLRKIVQDGVSFSRASAMCININCLLILLPVCRNLISYLRSCLCCSITVKRGLFDKHITYHRYLGYSIIFFSVVHTLGHIHNIETFAAAHDFYKGKVNKTKEEIQYSELLTTLSLLPNNMKNGTYINPIRSDNANTVGVSFTFASGVTGIVMCVALAVLISTSLEYMRRSFYNLFWYVHHIFSTLFLLALCLHGIEGIVRKQTNIDKNNPEKCYLLYNDWSSSNKACDIPQFAGAQPSSWIWILIPLIIYIIERITRFVRGLKKHKILKSELHASNVLELKIANDKQKSFKYTAGQYVYLNYPQISRLEWHPFTITSAPDDPYLSVHIRSAGDWTRDLIKKLKDSPNNEETMSIHVDGPYGSCAEDILEYSKVVLVGAGIGVTPYASILKHILNIIKFKKNDARLLKVYFFWICPSIDTFEWFGYLLKCLETELMQINSTDVLEYNIYVTKGWTLREAEQIARNDQESFDLFTGLKQKTSYGRPNFKLFFKELAAKCEQENGNQKVGVFFCGPSELSKELHKICNSNSSEKTRFIYNKENF